MHAVAEEMVVLETGARVSPELQRKWLRGEPMTQQEVALCMGTTRSKICHIEEAALAKIKKCLQESDGGGR